MLKAVIFDFDGVITDSEILHLRSFNGILEQFDIEISVADYYKQYLALTDFECFSLIVERAGLGFSEQQIRELIPQKNHLFNKLAATDGKIIDGVRTFLKMLSDAGMPMAICSGALAVEIELILEQSRLGAYFETVVSADDVVKGKPDPEGFLLALARLNENHETAIAPNECIVVEDSRGGLDAAKAAGMRLVAVTNSYEADQLTTADLIVNRLDELTMPQLQRLCD